MIVDLDTLERAFEVILRHAKARAGNTISVDSDHYWFIPEKERYDSYAKPSDFTIGQLTDDWENLKAIANGERQPTGLALRWLGEILIPTGERSTF